ncbi:hypothetical protein RRG08_062675 [Elysia crispata]|uniref:Uncharacterized protein n=1 Tax=Elysia crispata TaxID=231223 RepID=A0AAE0XMA8_9GAST|nr:hypothetical protein RRG08_062675 [Elysia crispata]
MVGYNIGRLCSASVSHTAMTVTRSFAGYLKDITLEGQKVTTKHNPRSSQGDRQGHHMTYPWKVTGSPIRSPHDITVEDHKVTYKVTT